MVLKMKLRAVLLCLKHLNCVGSVVEERNNQESSVVFIAEIRSSNLRQIKNWEGLMTAMEIG